MSHQKAELLEILRRKSLKLGEFVLSSGVKSNYYFDCKMTTTDAKGALLVGQVMLNLIREKEAEAGIRLNGVGGLTSGADPITFSVGFRAALDTPERPLQMFIVRKEPKAHGQNKLIEGNFESGNIVVVVDDVVTGGGSTLKAIEAVRNAGGTVAFVAVLVDRQQGGAEKITKTTGVAVHAAFQRDDLLPTDVGVSKQLDCQPA